MKRRCSFTHTLWASVLRSCCGGTVAQVDACSCWLKQTDKLRKGPCATVNCAVRGTGLLKTYFDPEGWSVCGCFFLLFHCFIFILKLYLHQKTSNCHSWLSSTVASSLNLWSCSPGDIVLVDRFHGHCQRWCMQLGLSRTPLCRCAASPASDYLWNQDWKINIL